MRTPRELVEIRRFRGRPSWGRPPGRRRVRMGERLVTAHPEAAGGRAEAEAQSVSFLTTGCVTPLGVDGEPRSLSPFRQRATASRHPMGGTPDDCEQCGEQRSHLLQCPSPLLEN
jgi:hypothetical protein